MGRLVSVGKNLVANTETIVYTVPAGYYAVWNLMYAHNATGTNKYLTADWYDASADVHVNILEQYNFTSKTYFQFAGNGSGVVMESGDQVHMTSEAGSTFGIICTFELFKKEGI
jgi:hypothetical protein